MPYRISGSDGAKSSPRLPADVTKPRLNFSGYPACCSAGNSKAPSAMMVTPDAPVKAVKKAQAASETMASPAGIQPSSALVSRTSRPGAPLSLSR